MQRALITGATSSIGAALARLLLRHGIATTAVVRPGTPRRRNLPAGVSVVACELAQLSTLGERLGRGYDAFFHLGWERTSRIPARDLPRPQARNIDSNLAAVELAHGLGCDVFVGSGSQAESRVDAARTGREDAVSSPDCYGVAKYAAGFLSRRLCAVLGMRHCWARIFSVYGPFDRESTVLMYCIRSLLRGTKPSFTPAEQRWDYLYCEDCARALYLIAQKGRDGAVYPLGSGRALPLRHYLECIRDLIDPSLPLGFGELEYPPGQPMFLQADIEALRRDTGFAPRCSFADGIGETITWVRRRHDDIAR